MIFNKEKYFLKVHYFGIFNNLCFSNMLMKRKSVCFLMMGNIVPTINTILFKILPVKGIFSFAIGKKVISDKKDAIIFNANLQNNFIRSFKITIFNNLIIGNNR